MGTNWIKATRLPVPYRSHHLHRPDINNHDMDDVRKSLSKMKKDFKHRLGGKKHGADRAGDNAAGETGGSSLSVTRPDSRVAASGRGEEGSRTGTDVSQAHSTDRSPQPNPMQADGGGDNPRGREANVDEGGASQDRSRPGPNVGGAAGSRPNREIKRDPSPLSLTSVTPGQGPDSTRTVSPQQPCLITLLDYANTLTVPDRVQGGPRPDENAEPNTATNEKKSNWKSTAFATAKLLLRGVRDSADAFGPLKSVAGGLCFILENCEV